MTVSLLHATQSTKPASPRSGDIDGPIWNEEHNLTAAVSSILGTNASSTTVTELSLGDGLGMTGDEIHIDTIEGDLTLRGNYIQRPATFPSFNIVSEGSLDLYQNQILQESPDNVISGGNLYAYLNYRYGGYYAVDIDSNYQHGSTNAVYGISMNASIKNYNHNFVCGNLAVGSSRGTSVVQKLLGNNSQLQAYDTSEVVKAYAYHAQSIFTLGSGTTITDAYSFYSNGPYKISGSTFTNFYDFYATNQYPSNQSDNRYGIYINHDGPNYFGGTIQQGTFTVATLPTAALGMTAVVTDASSPSIGSTVTGGGAANAQVWYNGSNWTVTGV